jgi:hypothetical protein
MSCAKLSVWAAPRSARFGSTGLAARDGDLGAGSLRQSAVHRFTEATRVLSKDSSRLAEVLIEVLAAATGDAEILDGTALPSISRLHTRDPLRDAA